MGISKDLPRVLDALVAKVQADVARHGKVINRLKHEIEAEERAIKKLNEHKAQLKEAKAGIVERLAEQAGE